VHWASKGGAARTFGSDAGEVESLAAGGALGFEFGSGERVWLNTPPQIVAKARGPLQRETSHGQVWEVPGDAYVFRLEEAEGKRARVTAIDVHGKQVFEHTFEEKFGLRPLVDGDRVFLPSLDKGFVCTVGGTCNSYEMPGPAVGFKWPSLFMRGWGAEVHSVVDLPSGKRSYIQRPFPVALVRTRSSASPRIVWWGANHENLVHISPLT
jgi:hypothetical protein